MPELDLTGQVSRAEGATKIYNSIEKNIIIGKAINDAEPKEIRY